MTMTDRTHGGASTVGGATGSSDDQLQQSASELADRASRTAGHQLSDGMTKAGEVLEQLADAVQHAGDDLRSEQPQLADGTAMVADRLRDTGRYLQRTDPSDLMHEFERFARRQPAIVIGGAFAAGFLASRFLRTSAPSSSRPTRGWDGPDAYGRVGYRGGRYGAQPGYEGQGSAGWHGTSDLGSGGVGDPRTGSAASRSSSMSTATTGIGMSSATTAETGLGGTSPTDPVTGTARDA